MRRPDFVRDLVDGIRQFFDEQGIRHAGIESSDPVDLLERYFCCLDRTIVPRPRRVHCSAEFRATLESLDDRYGTAIETIRSRFETGSDLADFLSRKASDASSKDGMLSDFGIHHFHLGDKHDPNHGDIERSDDLLFVFVQPQDAYFLDVRKHPKGSDPSDFGWCDEDLLKIIDSNWPEALEPYTMPGVKGTKITDEQRRELRRKNANVATQVGDKVIAPPGGGLLADGSNLRCKFQARRLLAEIRHIEQFIEDNWDDWMAWLKSAGLENSDSTELRLVRIADTTLPFSQFRWLNEDLRWGGWAIAETTS